MKLQKLGGSASIILVCLNIAMVGDSAITEQRLITRHYKCSPKLRT